jgi:hypothetical protein
MKHVDRLGLIDEKRELMARVDAKLGTAGVRGYALLDDSDHSGFANRHFSELRAFYADVAFSGVEELSPRYVYDIMSLPDCEHFIWISRREATASLPRFVWIYAHEVQHLVQRRSDLLCARANSLIRAAYARMNNAPRLPLEIPSEFDAELVARNVVRELLGECELQRYLEDQSMDAVRRAYLQRFGELERNWRGLRRETAAVLRARMDEFRVLQSELPDKEFQFDLEVLCGSSSRPAAMRTLKPRIHRSG